LAEVEALGEESLPLSTSSPFLGMVAALTSDALAAAIAAATRVLRILKVI
jgi:hypothetical protein